MKPFILRRLKTEVLKQLPQKIEEIIHCDMSTRQEQEYKNLIAYYKKRKDEILLEQTEKANIEKNKKLKASSNKASSKMDEILEIMNSDLPNNKNKSEKKETSDSSSNILMELRKAANHPLLRRVLYDNDKLKQMAKLIMKVCIFYNYINSINSLIKFFFNLGITT
jgi:SWI/SNF-related matrix-associated actin-dependent regulator of chromatin subfamily A containing DEAD/H box 1